MYYLKEELLKYRRPENVAWGEIIASAGGMAFCLLLGYFMGNLGTGGLMSLGFIIFAYYSRMPLRPLLKRLVTIGLTMLLVLFVSSMTYHVQWSAPLVIGLVAFLCRLLFRLYGFENPGALLLILIAAVGAGMETTIQTMGVILMTITMGITLAIIVAIIVHFTEKEIPVYEADHSTLKERLNRDSGALLDALFYAGVLFLAVYLSMGIGLDKPSWMIFSAAGILQMKNLRAMMNRNIQRITGTVLGLIAVAIITTIPMSPLVQIIIIIALYGTMLYSIRGNYALGMFFSTPMAILLTTMISPDLTVASAISSRFMGIVLGCIYGVVAAWVMAITLNFYNRKWHVDIENSENNYN